MVYLLALAVGLVLADSSVVTLALPDILREFSTSVGTVAWVLIAFNVALALTAVAGSRAARPRPRTAFAGAIALFAIASGACAAAPSIGALIAARAVQGIVGAVVVAAALELLVDRVGPRHAVGLWAAAGVLGAALGPAAGGLLTQAFSWQAMFALQAPVALLALAALRAGAPSGAPPAAPPRSAAVAGRPALIPLAALALVSAALSAALFLLVVLLIEGWRYSPAEAAATVTVMPIAALAAARWARGRAGLPAALAGCLLVAGGLAALGLLPAAGAQWTLVPQLAIGVGLGLALAILIGETVGDQGAGTRPAAQATAPAEPAAWTIAARHAGIVAGLLILTPIFTAGLNDARVPAQRAGVDRLLDAPLSLPTKLDLARALGGDVQRADNELPDLAGGFAAVDAPAAERPALARLRAMLDDELDRAGTNAFSSSFLAAALLALLAAGVIGLDARRGDRARAGSASNGSRLSSGAPLPVAGAAAGAAAALLVAVYIAAGGGSFKPQSVADPCAPRARPAGIERTQRVLLTALDGAACRLHMTREDLLLGLLDGKRPPGVSEPRFVEALRAGVDRARNEGALSALDAVALKLALSTRGSVAMLAFLLGR